MTQNFFLVYLGTLLLSSIALFAVVKQVAGNFTGGKKPLIYGSLSGVLVSAAAFASTFISNNLYTVFWVLTAIFVLFGIIHMRIVRKKFFPKEGNSDSKVLLGEIIFSISVVLFAILLFSSLQYFLKEDKSFLFFPMMMSTLGFFIPLMFMHTFEAAYSIPAPAYNTWKYPAQPLDLPEEDSRERLLVIGFEMTKTADENKRTYFRAKAPENIYLGDLFYFFMDDYNELHSETPIQHTNADQTKHEWLFRLKTKWFQSERMLDPSLTVKDNGIRENSVIICERT